jgi:hypothetical protein
MNTNHVVAEVRLDSRWVIVDPSFSVILKDSAGHLLTKEELARPAGHAETRQVRFHSSRHERAN